MAKVRLRPFTLEEFPAVWSRRFERGGDTDRNAKRRFRRRYETWTTGTFTGGFLQLAVEVDGRLAGDVQARRPKMALPPGAFEIGIELYDPADRGKGYGSTAIEQFTGLLFDEHDAGRVQASTALDNTGMRRVFEKLGYTLEGVLRGFWPREDGTRDDYALYAITSEDWKRIKRS